MVFDEPNVGGLHAERKRVERLATGMRINATIVSILSASLWDNIPDWSLAAEDACVLEI